MEMSFEEFEVAPVRNLSRAQEVRLCRIHLCGDASGGPWSTIASLIKSGYLREDAGSVRMTEKGAHYAFHYGREMPVK